MSANNSFSGANIGYESNNIFKYRNDNMCNKSKFFEKQFELCNVKIKTNPYGLYIIDGYLGEDIHKISITDKVVVKYWAASPPTYTTSYSGSALPFPNKEVAFENTFNQGIIHINNGKFTINIQYPNSYYDNMGNLYVPPQINFKVCDLNNKDVSKIYTINLGNGVPFRSLTYPELLKRNPGPDFYENFNLLPRTQAQIISNNSYPSKNKEPTNFWGTLPTN